MVKELIQRVFAARNCAHLRHWATDSYAEHMALGDFYDDVIESLDAFVEAYQGANNKVGKVTPQEYSGNVLKCLEDDAVWLSVNRDGLANGVSALENLLDNLMGNYLTALYKLRFLK